MVFEFKSLKCLFADESSTRNGNIKTILQLIDDKLYEEFKNCTEKPYVYFGMFYPEVKYNAKTANLIELRKLNITHTIFLNESFFEAYDKRQFTRCTEILLHELIHCYLNHGIAHSRQYIDNEERKVDRLVKKIMEKVTEQPNDVSVK
jgi:hypothetical protein